MKYYIRKHLPKKASTFWFQVGVLKISDIFYKIQNFNWWPVFPVITHWTNIFILKSSYIGHKNSLNIVGFLNFFKKIGRVGNLNYLLFPETMSPLNVQSKVCRWSGHIVSRTKKLLKLQLLLILKIYIFSNPLYLRSLNDLCDHI